jgi:hypothetical protein
MRLDVLRCITTAALPSGLLATQGVDSKLRCQYLIATASDTLWAFRLVGK